PSASAKPRWRRWRWDLILGLYLPFLLVRLLAQGMRDEGQVTQAAGLLDGMALVLAAYSLAKTVVRGRRAATEQRPLFHTLMLAAAAIMVAVVVGASGRFWFVSNQLVPANFIPAVLFSIAVTRLVFRL